MARYEHKTSKRSKPTSTAYDPEEKATMAGISTNAVMKPVGPDSIIVKKATEIYRLPLVNPGQACVALQDGHVCRYVVYPDNWTRTDMRRALTDILHCRTNDELLMHPLVEQVEQCTRRGWYAIRTDGTLTAIRFDPEFIPNKPAILFNKSPLCKEDITTVKRKNVVLTAGRAIPSSSVVASKLTNPKLYSLPGTDLYLREELNEPTTVCTEDHVAVPSVPLTTTTPFTAGDVVSFERGSNTTFIKII